MYIRRKYVFTYIIISKKRLRTEAETRFRRMSHTTRRLFLIIIII